MSFEDDDEDAPGGSGYRNIRDIFMDGAAGQPDFSRSILNIKNIDLPDRDSSWCDGRYEAIYVARRDDGNRGLALSIFAVGTIVFSDHVGYA